MRIQLLKFVAVALHAKDLGFDIEAAAEARIAPRDARRVNLAELISAFRFYSERKHQKGVTTAQVIWHLVGEQRVATLN
ncbi:MAG: hypothetical protein ABSC94_33075 [Polyangiaceae bacterium]|jgi:hypothetical protein